MNEVSFRGGSRIGWVNASYPFARLACTRERLVLGSFGVHEFTPDQVVSFGTFGSVPLLANGLAIEHNRLDYPARMVFWCLGSRDKVLEEIRRTGFVPRGRPVERPKSMPFRWRFAIGVILLWNLLLLHSFRDTLASPLPHRPSFDLGMPAACAMVFLLATGIKLSGRLQRLAIAPGHTLGEVRGMLTLLQRVSLPLGLGFGAAWLLGGH